MKATVLRAQTDDVHDQRAPTRNGTCGGEVLGHQVAIEAAGKEGGGEVTLSRAKEGVKMGARAGTSNLGARGQVSWVGTARMGDAGRWDVQVVEGLCGVLRWHHGGFLMDSVGRPWGRWRLEQVGIIPQGGWWAGPGGALGDEDVEAAALLGEGLGGPQGEGLHDRRVPQHQHHVAGEEGGGAPTPPRWGTK